MSLIYFEDVIHYYYTPALEDNMLEVGDMILYKDSNRKHSNDVGWIVYAEKHRRYNGDYARMIHIKWLSEDDVDHIWEEDIGQYKEFTLVKGGQNG